LNSMSRRLLLKWDMLCRLLLQDGVTGK